jgi:hypothetical protein
MLNLYINGVQKDFQAPIVFDSFLGKQSSYSHIYLVQNSIVGDDTSNELSKPSIFDPCLAIICENYGTCLIGFNNTAVCLCADGFSGKK